jgi:uroporphyrinogen decarboxylase
MAQFDFIKAAFGLPHKRVPIWIMRQAGRYLPEYRAVREKVSFLELCHRPDLVADVTRQPIDIFGLDAAIIFSDILLPLEPLGLKLSYDNGGPRIEPPVRRPDDIRKLRFFDPAEEMTYVFDAIGETKDRLNDIVPLIGFAGSPFTLACYLVEGGSSWNFNEVKKFLYNYPKDAALLLGKLAEMTGLYLKAQIEAGVDAVQIFDTWGGILPPNFYSQFSLPYIKTAFDICRIANIPRILYMNNTRPYLPYLVEVDCETVGIDWRTDLSEAIPILDGKALQGNLDPHLLFGPGKLVRDEANRILRLVGDHQGFIFNLGHGILPETPVKNVHLLVETVHSHVRPH